MINYLLMCRSLTAAQRTAKSLERVGIGGTVMRSPVMSPNGCGWCVRIGENRLTDAIQTLNRQELKPAKIYMMYSDGRVTEVVL